MNYYIIDGKKRVQKRCAKRLFNLGVPVFICPVNFRPNNMFAPATRMHPEEDFDTVVSYFETYQCINSETGRRAAFYVEVE